MPPVLKQLIPTLLIIVLCATTSFAQQTYDINGLRDLTNYWEISVSGGANNFLGDLGGTRGKGQPLLKDYVFPTNRLLIGASGTYNINNWMAVDVGFNYGNIYGADSLINNTGDYERWRWYRNLSFKSHIYEGYTTVTFYPIMWAYRRKIELFRNDPFVSVGVGVQHFNPRANLNGQWITLQPLHLEGQGFPEYPDRKPYARTKIYIPINYGVTHYFNNRLALSAGMMSRWTFTDYMDDISTTYIDPALFYKYLPRYKADLAKALYERSRTPEKVKPDIIKANSNNKDSYVTFYLKFTVILDKKLYIYYPKL